MGGRPYGADGPGSDPRGHMTYMWNVGDPGTEVLREGVTQRAETSMGFLHPRLPVRTECDLIFRRLQSKSPRPSLNHLKAIPL